jgi:Ca2+/Na+ antiporter
MESIKSLLLYIFDRNPGHVFGYYTLAIILIVALFIFATVFSHYYKLRKKHDFAFKKVFRNLSKSSYAIAALLTGELAMRYETIPYFSMRIWLYATLCYLLYLAYKYTKAYKVEYPKQKNNYSTKVVHEDKRTYTAKKK